MWHEVEQLVGGVPRGKHRQARRIGVEAVAQVVRRAGARVGLDARSLAGHSLRAGLVTEARRAGADAHAVMRQTRHRDPATVEAYARERAPLVGNAVTMVGL